MANQTPSKRLKRLYNSRSINDPSSLKDFAVALAANGTAEDANLVNKWFANKHGEE